MANYSQRNFSYSDKHWLKLKRKRMIILDHPLSFEESAPHLPVTGFLFEDGTMPASKRPCGASFEL